MCGICGYIRKELIPSEQLWKMNNTMYHRGPNDGGIWEEKNSVHAVGLAQRRLSVLDLSELGHQPMMTEDQRYYIVYNGETYNFQQIKEQLKCCGYSFKSNCDTEVILKAYAEWGNACFAMFNGMFAIAIYDRITNKLVLARDRVGKKPLYYYHKKGVFIFASELKPIMAHPDYHKEINKNMLHKYLCNKYIEAPYSIFTDTYKMLPGTYLEFQNGECEVTAYWKVTELYKKSTCKLVTDYELCKKRINNLIHDSVASRLVADVPIGVFLSGGIDSTLVTAIAQMHSEIPINTYSIGFYDKERNEAPYAKAIADYLGTNHHERYVTEEDIFELIHDLPKYFDEPFSDSSQLPTMLVSKMTADENVVALSGDGGDEIFCGYKMYDWMWVAQHADWIGNIDKKLPAELRAFIQNRNQMTKSQLVSSVMIEQADSLLGEHYTNAKYEAENSALLSNWQERRMLLDMQTYLPDEILAKTDRASMKYSLEVRCPLLDYRIIEESFSIPHKYKYYRFDKKHILKDITYQYVPKELLNRPKRGFGIPLRRWLRTYLKAEIMNYADPVFLKRQGLFNPQAVTELIVNQQKSDKIMYSSMLWSFYVFQLWYREYVDNLCVLL